MDFIKKHYEKILLGVVLLGLAVALVYLPFKIQSEREKLQELQTGLTHPKIKPLTNLDLTLPKATLARIATPVSIDFSTNNKLFNPIPWQKASDGHLIKLEDRNIGPKAVAVTKSVPLYLTLTLDQVTTAADGSQKYAVGVQKENAPTPAGRNKKQSYCKVGDKTDVFTLREIKGKPEDPSQLILIMNDTGETAIVSREQPFRRVDGYSADLAYKPENKSWANKRVGNAIAFNNEEYNIVAITKNEVVLSAKSNQKKWTVTYSAAPPAS